MSDSSTTTTHDNVVGSLVSVNVGMPQLVPWNSTDVFTGIYKLPVPGRLRVGRLNVAGDGQGDLNGHGGEQRAVLVYQQASYEHWSDHLGRTDLGPGSFGENFTVDGLPDDEVCIGDRYRIGTAEFEVTQPRVTCFRVGLRLGEPEMPALLVSHRRPGFYLRVIREGEVSGGDVITKTRTGRHALTVAAIDALLYLPDHDQATLRQAVDIPALSPGWQQSFRKIRGSNLRAATVTGPAIGTEPAWDGFRPMTVTRIVRETPSISSFYLSLDCAVPELMLPGQYLTLRVQERAASPAIRSYSISAVPDSRTYRISVRRDAHGRVSRFLHEQVSPGGTVEVAAPRGEFVLDSAEVPVLLLSAGVGATPLMAMLQALVRTCSRRDVWWIHTARRPEEHVFASESRELLDQLPRSHRFTFYTQSTSPSVEGTVSGRPTLGQLRQLELPTHTTAYVCGPNAFITDATNALMQLGLAATRIHSELFGALPPIDPGVKQQPSDPPHQPDSPASDGPAVTFARSGLTVRWRADDQSLLELAEACSVQTRWSCRTGVCHTCVTPMISGAVRYGPAPLELPPEHHTLICCAQPIEDTVLDA